MQELTTKPSVRTRLRDARAHFESLSRPRQVVLVAMPLLVVGLLVLTHELWWDIAVHWRISVPLILGGGAWLRFRFEETFVEGLKKEISKLTPLSREDLDERLGNSPAMQRRLDRALRELVDEAALVRGEQGTYRTRGV